MAALLILSPVYLISSEINCCMYFSFFKLITFISVWWHVLQHLDFNVVVKILTWYALNIKYNSLGFASIGNPLTNSVRTWKCTLTMSTKSHPVYFDIITTIIFWFQYDFNCILTGISHILQCNYNLHFSSKGLPRVQNKNIDNEFHENADRTIRWSKYNVIIKKT